MKKQFLECGRIVSTHGIKGDVRVQPWSDTPDFLLDFETLYFDEGRKAVRIEKARVQKNIVLLKLVGTDSLESAAQLRGQVLYVNRDDVAMEPGEYFVQDLIGCEVKDADTGKSYGKVYDSRPTGANDVYYLRDDKGCERLVPVIPQVVLERDIENGLIYIRPLPGLFDDEDNKV